MAGEFTYDKTDIVEHYDKARELPAETYQLWANAITRDLPCESICVVCDVGCGTGRFSMLLADKFFAQVVGIDPSKKMLAEAKCNISNSSITYVAGIAEALPLANSGLSALFLSMSYHHIQDMSQAISEFKRVLCQPGYIIIRTSTRQSLLTYPWLRFFPTACKIERCRIGSNARTSGNRCIVID